MSATPAKVGLVLSGGGAKGSYQAGVIKYLAEVGIQPHAVAGASIGSLNGVIIAGSKDILDAANRLEKIWEGIAQNSPIKLNKLSIFTTLLRIVLAMYGGVPGRTAVVSTNFLGSVIPESMRKIANDPAFLDNQPLIEIIDKFSNLQNISSGLPFWVSVFPSNGATKDIIDLAKAIIGFENTRKSEFIKIQDLDSENAKKALLASAAIPLAFEAQKIGDNKYYDGGMGGWWDVQGNTPITPLIENEKCTHIIVTHLEDGSFWDRRKFPQASILEVRTRGISRKGFTDMLSFEQGSILEWMKQGYEDAKSSIDPVLETLVSFESSKKAHDAAVDAVNTMSQSLDWLKG